MYTGETMTAPVPLPIETLLEHSTWMHALARRLVHDDDVAQDVMQETWLASLRTPPRHAESVRGWLSKVVRSKAADSGRAAQSRAAQSRAVHEARGEAAKAVPSVAESVADAESHRRVSELVLQLDANYRDVLVLRFFEGLPPREVARRLGCPVETVRTRTRRALERLRAELDTQHAGDRRAWALALVPLARLDRGAAATAGGAGTITGVALMTANTKFGLVAAAALVLGLSGGWIAAPAVGDDGEAHEAALVGATRALDTERGRAETLSGSLGKRDARIRALEQELAQSREHSAGLEAEVAELGISLSDAMASADTSRDGAPISFGAYDDVLDEIDWDQVGLATGELVQLLVSLRSAIDAGEELPPEVITGIQNKNAPLIAAAARIAGSLPGIGTNGPYASPPFMSNLIAATLRAAGTPLTTTQERELDRIANAQIAREKQRVATYGAETLELQKLHDDVVSRTKFFDAVTALLTAEQNTLLRPDSVRDVSNLDLFSSAIQWGQAVRLVKHDGTRASVAKGMLKDLGRLVRPAKEREAEIEQLAHEWAEGLSETLLESERDGLAALLMFDGDQVTRSSAEALRLYDSILRVVPLTDEARGRLRAISAPPIFLKL